MILFKKSVDLRVYLDEQRRLGKQIGWVPTMGALHDGHLSLLRQANQPGQVSVCSIFVNPTQFNVAADFEKYPVTIEKDIFMLEQSGVDILFLPSVTEIYPNGLTGLEQYPLGYLETIFEGAFRPGHFQGVCQVMSRFIKIVDADNLYMGEKDYQQCMVIRSLLDIVHSKTALHVCPTRREPDGLAMSSRNLRLTEAERKNAIGIYEMLNTLKSAIRPGSTAKLLETANEILASHDFRTDYVAIADASTLEPVTDWDGKQKTVALAAAFQHDVRLIDNMRLN